MMPAVEVSGLYKVSLRVFEHSKFRTFVAALSTKRRI